MTSIMCLAARNLRLALASLLTVAMAAGTSLAADASAATTPSPVAAQQPVEELQQLDEVWVRGERLAQLIVDAEDEFFARYNMLNTDRNFDVHCGYVALSKDSMIMTRACVPGFIASNQPHRAPMGRNCFVFISSSAIGSGSTGSPGSRHSFSCSPSTPPVSSSVSMDRRQEYAANVLKVVSGDPQLLDMAGDLTSLYREMELTQQRYVAVKPRHKYARTSVNPRAF